MTRTISLLFALLAALLPGLALAADPLVPHDATLANGLQIRVIEDHNLPLVSVVLMIPAGAAHDASDLQGTATMTARLLSEGTRDRSALELAEAIENLGADLDVDAGTSFTTVDASFLARDLPEGLALMAEVVDRPLLAAEDFDRELERAQANLAENLTYAPFVATRAVYAELYPDHPFGWAESGTEASLAAITVEDVQAFHKARYRPKGSVLCIVGDVKTREIARQAEHAFRGWRGKADAVELGALPAPWSGVRKVLVDMPEQTQIQVRIAKRTVARTHPDHLALRQANAVVGGGFTSRLMEEIRVERSLSYGASSSLWSFDSDAVFHARTFTANETAREALDVAWEVIAGWRAGGWPDEEYDRARNYTLGMVPQALETRLSRAWTLAMMSYHGLPADDMATRAAQVQAIERAESEAAVAAHLDADGWLVLVVGDLELVREQLDEFDGGGWEVIEVD
jgi:zinc protease